MKALSQPLFASLRGYDRQQLGPDLFSGVLIALLSIPISMGYAQLAGLPPVYGLYGSLIPILLFAMLSTTREFIFGVDAAPAAMIGGVLGGMGIAMGSAEAERVVPVLTFYVGIWLLLFALLSLLVLLLDGWTGGVSTTRFFCVYRSSLADPLTYVRFFGHVLGHSGYSHYMNNMLLLLLVGPGLEEKYGSRNLLMTILVTALVTGLVQFIFFPGTALLGASGVVFMMIVLNSFTEMRRGGIPLTMLLVVALYLGNEVVDGLSESDNISQMTHIVGGLCGIVFGFSLARAKKR